MAQPAFTAFSFILLVLVLIPAPWHWRARNIATLSTMAWLAFGNLVHAISSIVWANNVVVKWQVYCDITLAIYNASALGLPAAAFCITHHLESVSSPRHSVGGLNDKRYRRIFEIFMCIVLPFIFSGIHYVVQGHRFDIVEEIGCVTATYMSWAAIFLFYVPPMIISVFTTIYAGMALRWFMQRRAQFHELLHASSSGLTTARYFRLMGLALCEMLGCFITSLFVIVAAVHDHAIQPYVSWQFVHADFHRVGQFPKLFFPGYLYERLFGTLSLIPIGSFLFFAFFAFGEEAMAEYRRYWRWIRRVVFRRGDESKKGGVSTFGGMSVPSFVSKSDVTRSQVSAKLEMSGMGTSSQSSTTGGRKWDDDDDDDDDSLFGPSSPHRVDIEAPAILPSSEKLVIDEFGTMNTTTMRTAPRAEVTFPSPTSTTFSSTPTRIPARYENIRRVPAPTFNFNGGATDAVGGGGIHGIHVHVQQEIAPRMYQLEVDQLQHQTRPQQGQEQEEHTIVISSSRRPSIAGSLGVVESPLTPSEGEGVATIHPRT